jgi:hypothetical protein
MCDKPKPISRAQLKTVQKLPVLWQDEATRPVRGLVAEIEPSALVARAATAFKVLKEAKVLRCDPYLTSGYDPSGRIWVHRPLELFLAARRNISRRG